MTYSCYTLPMDGREDDFDEERGQVKFLDVYRKEYIGKEMASNRFDDSGTVDVIERLGWIKNQPVSVTISSAKVKRKDILSLCLQPPEEHLKGGTRGSVFQGRKDNGNFHPS